MKKNVYKKFMNDDYNYGNYQQNTRSVTVLEH